MESAARFIKWGLGLFLFGVFLTFGIVAHYRAGARWPTGELFMQNISLWWACPWTLSVAAVQAGGLGMVALGLAQLAAARLLDARSDTTASAALLLCVSGLIGVFLVGYPGYFAFDAVWPSFYYSPIATGKNAWLLAQALFIAVYLVGAMLMFNVVRRTLDAALPGAVPQAVTMTARHAALVLALASGLLAVPMRAPAQQVPAPQSPADVKGTPAGTVMTDDYVAAVGRIAYVWGWPLVNNLNRALAVESLPEPGRIGGVVPAAPPGYISMLTDYIDAAERFVTCPNQDTVYGAGFQRLDSKPVIVQVPDFGARFYTYQITDARTDSFASIGKQHGTKPGFYLLAGPNWKGDVPAGINAVFRSPTDLVAIFPRVFQDDTPEDKAAIQPLLGQVMVYPLSEFDGKMKTKDWKQTPAFPSASSGQGETRWVIPEKFFDQLAQVMKEIPPLPGEEALYGMIQSVLAAAENDPRIRDALTRTAVAAEDELIKPLFEFRNNGRPVGNGWTSPPNGARWGTDYLSRAATAKSNMYDNAPEETRYIYTDFDSGGQRLDGANRYTVTFAKGELPPVNGFWSLTLYNKEHLFEANALNRFSLGTKSKSLKFNPDGSLTLFVQNASPGQDKESNWLPAPGDAFSLYIRAYWPKEAILNGTWTPPAVLQTKDVRLNDRQ